MLWVITEKIYVLAYFLNECEDEIICDFAEYYHIYDIYSLPALYLATLVKGLRHDSRLATFISGLDYTHSELMQAKIADELSFLAWSKTNDAKHNRNRPKSLLKLMLNNEDEKEAKGFNTPEEYESARDKILKEVNNGN